MTSDCAAQLTDAPSGLTISSPLTEPRQAVALGGPSGGAPSTSGGGKDSGGDDMSDEDALQARLDALRRG